MLLPCNTDLLTPGARFNTHMHFQITFGVLARCLCVRFAQRIDTTAQRRKRDVAYSNTSVFAMSNRTSSFSEQTIGERANQNSPTPEEFISRDWPNGIQNEVEGATFYRSSSIISEIESTVLGNGPGLSEVHSPPAQIIPDLHSARGVHVWQNISRTWDRLFLLLHIIASVTCAVVVAMVG